MLHPADAFTAYTLKRGEIIYYQSPFTLPLPSWMFVGVTDKISMEIDLLPLIGGFFEKPHLPVPSFNFRFHLLQQEKFLPSLAIETMYQHLWNQSLQANQENLLITREGNSFFLHLNMSWKFNSRFYTHLSTGISYTEKLYMTNNQNLLKKEVYYPKIWHPDINLSMDYRYKPWLSFHLTGSYGSTFVYLDNIPPKMQLTYGYRIAPFYKSKKSFFRNFRAEFIGFYIHLPDVDESINSIVPLFPYFYWQWNINKNPPEK